MLKDHKVGDMVTVALRPAGGRNLLPPASEPCAAVPPSPIKWQRAASPPIHAPIAQSLVLGVVAAAELVCLVCLFMPDSLLRN